MYITWSLEYTDDLYEKLKLDSHVGGTMYTEVQVGWLLAEMGRNDQLP